MNHLCKLSTRKVLQVSGAEASNFLQGLQTNDTVNKQAGSLAFLNPKSRIISEAFFYKESDESIFLDLPEETFPRVLKMLKMYKLRQKLKLETRDDLTVWQTFSSAESIENESISIGNAILEAVDPRHVQMGTRSLLEATAVPDLDNIQEESQQVYDLRRYMYGIGEGAEVLDKLGLYANLDYLDAVSFRKGCYIGQELIARTKTRLHIRQRMLPLEIIDESNEESISNDSFLLPSYMQKNNSLNYSSNELSHLPRESKVVTNVGHRRPLGYICGAQSGTNMMMGVLKFPGLVLEGMSSETPIEELPEVDITMTDVEKEHKRTLRARVHLPEWWNADVMEEAHRIGK